MKMMFHWLNFVFSLLPSSVNPSSAVDATTLQQYKIAASYTVTIDSHVPYIHFHDELHNLNYCHQTYQIIILLFAKNVVLFCKNEDFLSTVQQFNVVYSVKCLDLDYTRNS